ncbi:hypothetical protein ACG-C91_0055 [Escherichia phage vB_EcoP_ACG-C91]|uniref:Uncharacterized protein n=1 Tax=Escherichia phage vB_EcoP_ACG-C91 TaxID=1141139 RepID=K4FE86_9CAUD|nr:hypothetical protein D860_gp56 [Escherichia phage vB_EcoP_ACG-C91]AFH19881.1 hypothetical protein ACG-C91_0055 [Escherichia phage vB_EcoP_ACG-C91]
MGNHGFLLSSMVVRLEAKLFIGCTLVLYKEGVGMLSLLCILSDMLSRKRYILSEDQIRDERIRRSLTK